MPFIVAVAVIASLITGIPGSAAAAVRQPVPPVSVGSALHAESLTIEARLEHLSGKAQDGSRTLSVGIALMASTVPARGTASGARVGAEAVPAGVQGTVTLLPGITLTISSTGIQLAMTKEAVEEIQTVAGAGEEVAEIVGGILDVALSAVDGGEIGGEIADIVAAALGLGSEALAACTSPDGSATFSVPWPWLWVSGDLPSCSGI
jgi:hypothetical protein